MHDYPTAADPNNRANSKSAIQKSRFFFPALFFLGWALFFTYPLLLNIGAGVVLSNGDDAWLHLWDLWWANKSLVDLHTNPYLTTYLYYPTGVNLVYHSLDILNGLLSIPLQHLFSLTITFNILLIANLTFDGLAAYWLCLGRTGSIGAALVGGALFASAPLMGTSVNLGQLDEVTAWWLPLYIIALWRAIASEARFGQTGSGRRAVLCAGLCLVGASLATWYFTAGLVIFTIFFVPAYLLARRARGAASSQKREWMQAVAKVAIVILIFVVILSPLLVAMIGERLSGATYMLPSYQTTLQNSADLVGLFLPGRTEIKSIDQHGSNVALGLLALALGIVGLARRWRALWPVGLALFVITLMALGPHLQVGGSDTQLPMPYALLNNVPFIGASRQPLRFLATSGICLSLLAAFGTAWLLQAARPLLLRRVVVPAILVLCVAELFGIPRAVTSTAVAPTYAWLHDAQVPGAVMELPYENWQAKPQFYQSVTNRPVLGGYTSRHYPYPFIESAPGAKELSDGFPATLNVQDIYSPTLQQSALASLDYYNVRYVVLHKPDLASGRFGRLVGLLKALYASGPVYDDADVSIYETPVGASTASPGATLPLVGLGRGWYDVETNPIRRWTGSDPGNGSAFVWVGIRPQAAGPYTLTMDAFAYGETRHLSVVLNGKTLFTKAMGQSPETVEVELGTLQPGDYSLVLKVDEPPTMPPNDRRLLSIGVTRLVIARSSR